MLTVLLRRMWRRNSFWVRVMWGPCGGVTVMTSKGSALGTALYAWLLLGPACRQQQGWLRLNDKRPLTEQQGGPRSPAGECSMQQDFSSCVRL